MILNGCCWKTSTAKIPLPFGSWNRLSGLLNATHVSGKASRTNVLHRCALNSRTGILTSSQQRAVFFHNFGGSDGKLSARQHRVEGTEMGRLGYEFVAFNVLDR